MIDVTKTAVSDRRGQGQTNDRHSPDKSIMMPITVRGTFYPDVEDAVRSNGTDTSNRDGTNDEFSDLLSCVDRF